jgi:hypothetical protein
MVFDWKTPVGHGKKSPRRNSTHFTKKVFLSLHRANVFKHRVAVHNIEGVLLKRQRFAGSDLDVSHTGIGSQDGVAIRETGTGQILSVRIELLEHIRIGPGDIARTDIQDPISGPRLHGLHEQTVNAFSSLPGDASDKILPGVLIVPLIKLGGLTQCGIHACG